MNTNFFKVAAFYAFAELKNIEELQMTFTKFLQKESIKGTVLLAQEGVNGTVAGTEAGIEEFKNFLQSQEMHLELYQYLLRLLNQDNFPLPQKDSSTIHLKMLQP